MARPRQFDPETALQAIKEVFWRYGYEGASMQAIEAETGLKKQSLYRWLGDKRAMYLAALSHYEQTEAAEIGAILRAPGSAKARFAAMFAAIIDQAVKTGDRRGCFLCNASVDQAPHDAQTQAWAGAAIERLRQGFVQALSASLPYDADEAARSAAAAELLAAYFGLRVLIKAGVCEARLREAASAAIGRL